MAFEILHAVKRPTVLRVKPALDKNLIEAGKIGAVDTNGYLDIAANESVTVVGVFQTQGYVPAYQSTGLLDAQINGAVGSAGGGKAVSLVAGAGAVIKTDQFINLAGATIGAELVAGAGGLFKVTAGTGTVVGLLIGKDGTSAVIQLRV